MSLSKRAMGVSPSLTLAISAKAKKMKADGLDVVSFGAGEPDFDTPKYIIDAAKEALDKGMTRYTPASGTMELRKAICDKLQRENGVSYDPSQIVVSNGAKHSLSNAIRALVEEGDEVIIPAPFWLTYPELVKLSDGTPVIAELKKENGYKLTPPELKKLINPKTKAIIINNPCNPTGVVYSKDEIAALAKELENYPQVYIIADEIYEKLVYGVETMSIAAYSESIKARTVIVNGMSKAYAMTGWRIGYTASDAALAKAMGSIQSHSTSNPNSIAQYASMKALSDPEGKKFLTEMVGIFAKRRNLMVELTDKIGLPIIKPEGAFYVMIDVSSLFGKKYDGEQINSAFDVASVMLDKLYTAVIPCESFGAPHFVRLSYATNEGEIRKGLERFEKFVKGCK